MKLFHRVSDWAAVSFGSPGFFVFHLIWWGSWVILPVEVFPYGLLTLVVSLESILLSGLILNATSRSAEYDRKIMDHDYDLDKESIVLLKKILEKLDDKV